MDNSTGASPSKKRKITDKSLPADISTLAPDAAMYNDLLESERKLDWTMARKRIEITDALTKTIKVRKTLRVFVTHTAADQPWQNTGDDLQQTLDFETGQGLPSWSVKIEGKLLDEGSPTPPRKFSTFLKGLVVEIDRDPTLFPESNIVEWIRPANSSPQDGFVFRRRGDASVRIRILLHLDHMPERYTLAPPLNTILNIRQGSRAEVITALWNYIKTHGLQDKNDRRIVRPDPPLRRIFNQDGIMFHNVAEGVSRYLQPSEPVVIYHTVRVDPEDYQPMQVFDIPIEMDDVAVKAKMQKVVAGFSQDVDGNITALDDEIIQAAQAVRNATVKREFLTAFADDPQKFLAEWIGSQARDLDTILGTDRGVSEELMRRGDFFKLPWVEEAVAVHEGMRVAGALPNHAVNR